jgi:hypothetical protein
MKLMRVKNITKTYRKNVMYCKNKNKNRKRQCLCQLDNWFDTIVVICLPIVTETSPSKRLTRLMHHVVLLYPNSEGSGFFFFLSSSMDGNWARGIDHSIASSTLTLLIPLAIALSCTNALNSKIGLLLVYVWVRGPNFVS